MTVYQELTKIKNSLMSKINQFSHKDDLNITVQTEEFEFGVDTVMLLCDSSDSLLLDETYTTDHLNTSQAITRANELHSCISSWIADENVHLNEEIKEVCF